MSSVSRHDRDRIPTDASKVGTMANGLMVRSCRLHEDAMDSLERFLHASIGHLLRWEFDKSTYTRKGVTCGDTSRFRVVVRAWTTWNHPCSTRSTTRQRPARSPSSDPPLRPQCHQARGRRARQSPAPGGRSVCDPYPSHPYHPCGHTRTRHAPPGHAATGDPHGASDPRRRRAKSGATMSRAEGTDPAARAEQLRAAIRRHDKKHH